MTQQRLTKKVAEAVREAARQGRKELPTQLSDATKRLVLLAAAVAINQLLKRTQPWGLVKPLLVHHPKWSAAILTLAVIIVGWGLALWKKHYLMSYAWVEVVVGAVISFNNLLTLAPTFELAKILATVTSLYIVSRGFNNVLDARKAVAALPATAH